MFCILHIRFWIRTLLHVRQAIHGYILARRLVRLYPGKEIFFTFFSIGDTVLMLSYLKEYKMRHSIDALAVVSDYTKNVAESFGFDENEIIVIDKKEIENLIVFFGRRGGINFAAYTKYGKIIKPVTQMHYIKSHNLSRQDTGKRDAIYGPSYSDITKRIYGIPEGSMPAKCKRLDGRELVRKLEREGELKLGLTVLMNPYAYTYKMVPFSFFQKIADALIGKGFKVLTSIYGEQKPLRGSTGVHFSLAEALALADACNFVIGLRSGFMDFIAFSDAVILCVDFKAQLASRYWQLEDCWPQNSQIKTFYWSETMEGELVKDIVDFVDKKVSSDCRIRLFEGDKDENA